MLYDVKEANPQLEIDWRAYFYRFVQEHGEPVEVSPIESDRFRIYSRLLFRDGWMYGAMDYQGPEFSPPGNPDQLRKLKLEYWTIREEKLRAEHSRLAKHIRTLRDWQTTRSIPLQTTSVYYDRTETGRPILKRTKPEDMDLRGLERKLADLGYLLAECEDQLKELNDDHERRD